VNSNAKEMYINTQKIEFFRKRIPSFACESGCHDCCGPVTTSSYEMANLPVKSDKAHAIALNDLSCPHLDKNGCTVYLERPLICRLFGTTPKLACPRGKRPEIMTNTKIEQDIYHFFEKTRQVLV
jgi:Fe-S-cluster containining protein